MVVSYCIDHIKGISSTAVLHHTVLGTTDSQISVAGAPSGIARVGVGIERVVVRAYEGAHALIGRVYSLVHRQFVHMPAMVACVGEHGRDRENAWM